MSKNLWGIIDGSETTPTNSAHLIAWEKREERSKSIIALTLSDSKLHLIYLKKNFCIHVGTIG